VASVSVLLVLALVLPPAIASRVNERRIARGGDEVVRLASAIARFERDVGEYPKWLQAAGGTSNRVAMLIGPGEPPKAAESGGGWMAATSDTFDRQLVSNGPGYPPTRWRGPYLASPVEPDPWGNRYMAWLDAMPFIVSAGPNGTIDSTPAALAAAHPAGDDIVASVGR
jgi:hypothetical protein